MSQELRDIAHWFLLYNSPEIEKYLQYVFLIIIYILTIFMLLVINNSSISLINQNYLSREHLNYVSNVCILYKPNSVWAIVTIKNDLHNSSVAHCMWM